MTQPGDFDSKLRAYLDARAANADDPAVTARIVNRTVNGDGRSQRVRPLASVALAAAVVILVGAPTTWILLHHSSTPHPAPAATSATSSPAASTPSPFHSSLPGVTVTQSGAPSPWREFAAFGSGPGLPLIMYGGDSPGPAPCTTFYFDTYIWDGSHWYKQEQADGPHLAYTSVSWDPVGKRLLLVGEPAPTCYYTSTSAAQTWAWKAGAGLNGTWVRLAPQHEPSEASTQTVMAADAADAQVFLMVYDTGADTSATQAWTWDGSDWTQRGSWLCTPVQTDCAVVPYAVVSAPGGGIDGLCAATTGSICKWTGGGWSVVPGTGVPGTLQSATVNPATGHIVGYTPGALYTYDGSQWIATPLPSELQGLRGFEFAAMSTPTTHLVLWGGQSIADVSTSDTWVYDGNSWTRAGP